ncbi:MAG: hypothetical protein K0R60_42 [Microbacterium sp.]|nr:hypothetical protein [Microbacterium sp.]
MNGFTISYAEIDGIRVCILDDGRWCERDYGHAGLHVIDPTEGPLLVPQEATS